MPYKKWKPRTDSLDGEVCGVCYGTKAPNWVQHIIDYGIKNGVLFGCDKHAGLGNTLKIKPPSVITYDHINKVLSVFYDKVKLLNKRGEWNAIWN